MRQFGFLGIALALWSCGLSAHPLQNQFHPEVEWHNERVSTLSPLQLKRYSLPCYQTLQQVILGQEDPRYQLFKAEIFGQNAYLRLPVYRFAEMRAEMVFIPSIGKVANTEEAGKLIKQLHQTTESSAWSLPTILDIPLIYNIPVLDSSHEHGNEYFFWVFVPKREVQLARFAKSERNSKLKFVEYVRKDSPVKFPVIAIFNSGRINKKANAHQQ